MRAMRPLIVTGKSVSTPPLVVDISMSAFNAGGAKTVTEPLVVLNRIG